MRILKVRARNFCSYKTLEFDFTNQGLSGIFGTTGAGKSTLMDVVPWCLWGTTSKNGAADDVRAWETEIDQITEVHLSVLLHRGSILVSRLRGGAGKTDLYWREQEDGGSELSAAIRGKDLKDTQRLLNDRLGVTPELFLTAGYMSQFSEADTFFVASAKARREVLEKIADQEFAIKLGERASTARKKAKVSLDNVNLGLAKTLGQLESLKSSLSRAEVSSRTYVQDTERKAEEWDRQLQATLDKKYARMEALKDLPEVGAIDDAIKALSTSTRCGSCGALSDKNSERRIELKLERARVVAKYKEFIQLEKDCFIEAAKINPHQVKENPFAENIARYKEEIETAEERLTSNERLKQELQTRAANLTWLYDKSFELRGLMMERVVREVETKTNYYLERFFDGALRVQLRCSDSDKLDVEVSNKGYACPFLSLSGGERTMLKLSFSLSLMQAAQNKAGIALNCLMLDEPLNGLPEDLKVKAFSLFEQLTDDYATVLVIDHSSLFQQQFHRKFIVIKIDGHSALEEQ